MHVGLVVFSDIDGGFDLANLFHDRGVEVSLFMSASGTARAVNDPDHPVERTYQAGILAQAVNLRLVNLPRMRDPRSLFVMRRLSQLICEDGIEIAHILMGPGDFWLAVLACFLRQIPVASTMIIPKMNIGERQPAALIRLTNKLLILGSDMILVNGKSQVEPLMEKNKLRVSRIAYAPLSLRITALKWSRNHICEEPYTILFFGAARVHKGLNYLIQAQPIITSYLPQTRFIIASHGEDMERCKLMIQDKTKFEIYEGFIPGDMASELIQRASIVVLPYLSASTSGVVNTALAFGKPVITTLVGCLPEYIQDGVTGLLVPPYDVELLANAVVRLLSDCNLRRRMRENIKAWINNHQDNTFKETVAAYEKAINIHNHGKR